MSGPLHARIVSTAIAPHLARTGPIGRVHSVFRTAVNMELADELVTFALPSTGALPNGVVVDTMPLFEPGASVWSDGGMVLCQRQRIDLRRAEAWSPVLQPGGALRPLAEVRGALAPALAAADVRGGFSDDLRLLAANGETPARARDLAQALRYGDLSAVEAAASRLIGLGQGLTPSGDDFLVGVCAALRAVAHPLHTVFGTACAERARGRTTTVAEMFYRFAARGMFSARIHELIASLSQPGADLVAAFERALDWGASSGADCLLGVLVGGEAAARVGVR
jgi:hypothetical protein